MAKGTVKWFNHPSGFGVITADDGGECFVYQGSLVVAGTAIDTGDRVAYEAVEGGMGAQASEVRRIDAAPERPLVPACGGPAVMVWDWEGGAGAGSGC